MSGIGFLGNEDALARLGADLVIADLKTQTNAVAKVSIAAAESALETQESTTFADLTDTTETAISEEITIVVGDSGAVYLSSELEIDVTGGAGELGNFPVKTIWKWHNGTAYEDISSEETDSDPVAAIADVVLLHAGTTSWVVPAGVTSVTAHCIGAGGNGAAAAQGGGGGGGEYAEATLSVTPEATVSCQIGAGGSGDDTWFVSTGDVLANAGANGSGATGGAGGTGGTGDSTSAGGAGGDATAVCGAGGGGSAGPGGAGKDGGGGSLGGGGGGGCNGGTSTTGGFGDSNSGGGGGVGPNGTGGGAGGTSASVPTAGTDGGGGGGGYYFKYPITSPPRCDGAAGAQHSFWTNAGPGGGGGGGGGGEPFDSKGGPGGGYGGGGGGGRAVGGVGAPGLIAIETGALGANGTQVTNAGKTGLTPAASEKFRLYARTTRNSTRTIGFTGYARAQTDDPTP